MSDSDSSFALCSVCDRDAIFITEYCEQPVCYKHEEEYIIDFNNEYNDNECKKEKLKCFLCY